MNSVVKAIKNQDITRKSLRYVMLAAILFVLYWQLRNLDKVELSTLRMVRPSYLIIAFILIYFNWYFEWLKWRICLKSVKEFDRDKARVSFFSGQLTGFLTPSALGNFLGRIPSYSKEQNEKLIPLTLLSNASQFLVSFGVGLVVFSLISKGPFPAFGSWAQVLVWTALSLLVSAFFFLRKIPFLKSLNDKIKLVNWTISLRVKLLSMSFLRYLTFCMQFWLVISAFYAVNDWILLLMVSYLYLFTTLSPSIFFGKLFIRESLAIFIFSYFGIEISVALSASLIVWLMNNILPTLFAYLYIGQLKKAHV
jgi:hypothetical protein